MESISRISSLLETARDLTLEAARDAGPRNIKLGNKPVLPAQQIKKLLDGRNERDVLDGLRRVIAMQYANPPQPTLPFFPAVLKTLSHPYPSTRPLVYGYLLHHAEADPDTALLAVNTIQKSLGDSNPRVRAMALKTMSGIRVPVLSQIISLAIKRGSGDLSPLVRKAAALACIKCVRLDAATQPQVEEYLATLLADKQYYVAGAAVQAFMEICPDRLELIHSAYRRLCKMVVDMDEWGQLATLRLMTIYARRCFPRRTRKVRRTTAQSSEEKTRSFYESIEPNEDEVTYDEVVSLDPDLELFLESVRPLLQSRNSAVILSVAKAYLYLSPTQHLPYAVGPLMALLRSPEDIQYTAFHNIVQIALLQPTLFVPYTRHFLLRSTDAPPTRRLKLELLTLTFPHSTPQTQSLILTELEHFSHSHDAETVRDSVHAIGRCAQNSSTAVAANPATAKRCLTLLLRQIHSADANLVGEAIDVVRLLIQRDPAAHAKTIVRLARNLDTLVSPTARASVVWLVGEFAAADATATDGSGDGGSGIAADVLRLLVRGYADEDDVVKAQIVLLSAKVYLHWLNARKAASGSGTGNALGNGGTADGEAPATSLHDDGGFADGDVSQRADNNEESAEASSSTPAHPIPLLYAHTLLLARYTPSYDLRDRARTYRALLGNGGADPAIETANTDLASLLLLAPKPVPLAPSPGEARKGFILGSASLVIGEKASSGAFANPADGPGKVVDEVPDWVAEGEQPDSQLRNVAGAASDESVPRSFGVGSRTAGVVSAGSQLDDALRSEESLGRGVTSGLAGGVAKKAKTLDDWLDEEDDDEDEEESSIEGEEEESGEEETSSGEEYEDDEESESEDDDDDDDDARGEKTRLVR